MKKIHRNSSRAHLYVTSDNKLITNFEVLTAVLMKFHVFWDIMPY